MSDNNFTSVMDSLLKGIDSVISTKTVVGEAKQIGDTIILPLVDVSFGLGAGKSGGGVGGKITPSAVLVIKDGHTKLVNIKNQDTLTKILDMVPDVIDKFTTKKEDELMDDNSAKELAFPENASAAE